MNEMSTEMFERRDFDRTVQNVDLIFRDFYLEFSDSNRYVRDRDQNIVDFDQSVLDFD